MILVTNNEGRIGAPKTAELLAAGATGLDAVEAGIRLVEADPENRTVGPGGWPNLLGEVELDAAVMDGTTLRTGAVGSLKGFLYPISVARRVMTDLPHEILVGEGAARFAREIGAEAGETLLDEPRKVWQAWYEREVPDHLKADWPEVALSGLCRHTIDPETGKDTTIFIAQDQRGELVAGVSTSGWGWKHPGRLGDSPIVGAGFYADSRYGAAACTGTGEMAIRCTTARSVVLYMKRGATVAEAVHEAAADMKALKGGLIGRITIHAIDRDGGHQVVAVNGGPKNTYWLWQDGDATPRSLPAEVLAVHDAHELPDPAQPYKG